MPRKGAMRKHGIPLPKNALKGDALKTTRINMSFLSPFHQVMGVKKVIADLQAKLAAAFLSLFHQVMGVKRSKTNG